ncbi:hypothetical protein BOTNAR_0070g00260 [Botryotinia narcissicola]|uniref:Uncharacterized protein n=1 Tax=Botryotinia narcissicola TaxID=278944 RepID=A0A4Z1J351_9HELO|nr:hypothetical protein BOTNAR_0070g00260 [Botryotinia narcissicola]
MILSSIVLDILSLIIYSNNKKVVKTKKKTTLADRGWQRHAYGIRLRNLTRNIFAFRTEMLLMSSLHYPV